MTSLMECSAYLRGAVGLEQTTAALSAQVPVAAVSARLSFSLATRLRAHSGAAAGTPVGNNGEIGPAKIHAGRGGRDT
jgi:hypothetical protein